MNKLLASGTLSDISREGDVIDIQVAPPADVGTFSEEERSRQVSYMLHSSILTHDMCPSIFPLTSQHLATLFPFSHLYFLLSAHW